jgi:hypothetical protein
MHRPGGKPLSFLVEVFSGMTRGAVLFGAIAFLRTAGRVTQASAHGTGMSPRKTRLMHFGGSNGRRRCYRHKNSAKRL